MFEKILQNKKVGKVPDGKR